jgi:hypothetical protein
MGFYIAKETLEKIKKELEKDYEICGILEMYDLDLEGYEKMIIPSNTVYEGKRPYDEYTDRQKSCEVPKEKGSPLFFVHEEFKYHTHPETSYSYPSFEDLFSVMKKRSDGRRLQSFIFTKWGVWTLFPTDEKIDNYNKNKYENRYNSSKTINEFRRKTEPFKRSHQSKPLGEVREDICKYVDTVNKLFEKYIVIRLYTWEDIERDYGYLKEPGLVCFETE